MAKGKVIVRNSPVIRNAHLIGAGNKFSPVKDTGGNIQWQASVAKQATPEKDASALLGKMEQTAKSMSFQNTPSRTTDRTPNR